VLLVSIDTLRADALGSYGRRDADTPLLDRVASEGVRFAHARSHNVVTLPAHANMLSGRLPLSHGVRDNSGFRFPAGVPTLATLLKERGYRTAAFVSAFVLDSRFGLDRGFDVYDDRLGGAEVRTEFHVPERRGQRTVELARQWWAQSAGGPRFAFVHLYEPHFPYEAPEPFRSRHADRPYQGEVAAVDAALAPLLEPILAAGSRARTLVIVTSDHGESLGEHEEMTHGIFAYEATLRVPLLIHAPGLLSPRIVADDVGLVDLLPTILDALGLPPGEGLDGRSLWPLAFGRGLPRRPLYFESLSSALNRRWAPLYGVYDAPLKYIDLPMPELYDLSADAAEKRNLVASRPQDLERLRALLGRLRAADRGISRVEEEAAALQRLRALGYVAGGGAEIRERYSDADDPKNLVGIDTRIRQVIERYRAGDFEGALALCRENIRERPEMPISHLHLAYLERARGNLPAAVAAARRSFELQPLEGEAISLYAAYLTEAGDAAEAARVTAPYLETGEPDLDVLTAHGMALARLGRFDAALATFERGRGVDPTNALNLVNQGTVHLMRGDGARARAALEAALAIDPGTARAWNGLGVIAMSQGQAEEAIQAWQRAVELDPRDYQTLFNLGATLRNRGRSQEARTYLEAYLREAPRALESRDIARVEAWLRAN
jgi:arylsulfatase A-like enzyme/Tfp pilus assembly protein PilF